MNAAYPQDTHAGALLQAHARTLRETLEHRGATGHHLGLEAALAQLVPLCMELAEIHGEGYGFYLHPSSITETPDGRLVLARERASEMPIHPRDRACLPPESIPGHLSDARGNVYALGAILYELVTGESVGPGMRRPSELSPHLPKSLDALLTVMLIVDPSQRPDDLTALAQSLGQLARANVPVGVPAPAITYNSQPIQVEVSLSLLPPEPSVPPPPAYPRDMAPYVPEAPYAPELDARAADTSRAAPPQSAVFPPVVRADASGFNPYGAVIIQNPGAGNMNGPEPAPPSAPNAPAPAAVNGYGVVAVPNPTENAAALAAAQAQAAQAAQMRELKAQIESDTQPRYYVQKSNMDHGPFTAMELVRHIDSHSFTDEDTLVDSTDGRRAPIREWPLFAQFAEHAKRNRQLMQRQRDIVKVAAAEKKSSRGKTLIGLLVLVGVLGAGGAWYSTLTGERRDGVVVQEDEATNVETESSVAIKGKKGGKARRRSAGGSGIPSVSAGQSCEAAMDSYNEVKVMGEQGQADITSGQYGRVLNSGSYFSHCGVPFSMSVDICAAVQNGRAVGVTVSTQPSDAKKATCIANAVRNLNFPSHPKLDVTRTRFAAQ